MAGPQVRFILLVPRHKLRLSAAVGSPLASLQSPHDFLHSWSHCLPPGHGFCSGIYAFTAAPVLAGFLSSRDITAKANHLCVAL